MPGWVVHLVLSAAELGAVGLGSAARLVFGLFQSELNFDVDQVSVDVANNHEHRDGFVESFVLGPGNGTTDRVPIGQYLRSVIRNTDVAARFFGYRSNLNSGFLPFEGHFLRNDWVGYILSNEPKLTIAWETPARARRKKDNLNITEVGSERTVGRLRQWSI